ncbi:hypothetical protein GP486_000940 [Trichoglossum hirsutum]|uniref:Uncharacterized protein n=1 Tax=Trichoglossum hirsutum TaxID=265104 RepID=A0A9P8RT64_9PEZI|nr:hypothetical protein GP486_000940 [Trichoglossum hirsutum]
MSYLLDPDPASTVQVTKRSTHPTDLQKDLPPQPLQDSQEKVTIQADGPTQLSQSLSALDQYGPGRRSQSIDQPRSTLYPPSQRAGATRSTQDAKFSFSGLSPFSFRRRSGQKNPSSAEKSSPQEAGGSKTHSGGTEESAQVELKIYESYRSDSPKRPLHNTTNEGGQPGNHNKADAAKTSTISVQNASLVATAAIGASSEVTDPKPMQPHTGNRSDTEKQLATISKKYNREVERNSQLVEERDELKRVNWRLCEENNGSSVDMRHEKRYGSVGTIAGGQTMSIECVISYKVSALTVSYIVLTMSHHSLGNGVYSRQRSALGIRVCSRLLPFATSRAENEAIKSAKSNGAPAGEYELLANQYKDLKRHCDNLVKENRQLRFDLKLESEKDIMDTFQMLCCDITNTCCRYWHGGELVEIRSETVHKIEELLQIRNKISRKYLGSPEFRLALSRACLSQLLAKAIFHDPEVDIGNQLKDLWANNEMAECMARLEMYMYGGGMLLNHYSF